MAAWQAETAQVLGQCTALFHSFSRGLSHTAPMHRLDDPHIPHTRTKCIEMPVFRNESAFKLLPVLLSLYRVVLVGARDPFKSSFFGFRFRTVAVTRAVTARPGPSVRACPPRPTTVTVEQSKPLHDSEDRPGAAGAELPQAVPAGWARVCGPTRNPPAPVDSA